MKLGAIEAGGTKFVVAIGDETGELKKENLFRLPRLKKR